MSLVSVKCAEDVSAELAGRVRITAGGRICCSRLA